MITDSRARRRLLAGLACAAAASFGLVAATTAGATTAPTGEVYVADLGGGTSQLGTDSTGVAHALPYPTAPGGLRPSHVIVSPSGKYAYALDCTTGQVLQYAVDTAGLLTGSLVPLSPAASPFGGCLVSPAQPEGHVIAESKSGKFVFVAGIVGGGGGLNTLLDFSVGTTGALTQAHFAETQSLSVNSVAVAPSGKFVYVGDPDGLIFSYAVDAKGVLTEGPAVSADACLSDLTIAPSGKTLYTTSACTNTVAAFPVNTSTGAVGASVSAPAGAGAAAVAVAPNGKTLYVANANSGSVSQYSIGKTGLPTPLSPPAVAVGSRPMDVAVSPSSKNLYVTNFSSNNVSEFGINAKSLLITPIGTVAVGSQPWGVAVRK